MKKKKTNLIILIAISMISATIATAGVNSYLPIFNSKSNGTGEEHYFDGGIQTNFNSLSINQEKVVLSVDSVDVVVGGSAISSVNVSNGDDVGLVSVNLSWDSSLVNVSDVVYNDDVWDDFLGPGMSPNLDNDMGYLVFDAYNFSGGVSMDTWLARLVFEPVSGITVGCCDFNFTDWMVANSTSDVLSSNTMNGTICVTNELMSSVVLSVDSVDVVVGGSAISSVNVSNGDDVGLVSVNLSWDSSLVNVSDVVYNDDVWDDFLGPGMSPNLDNDMGYLVFDAYNFSGGVSMDTWLARLVFEPVSGITVGCCDFNFTDWMVANSTSDVLSSNTMNGTICVSDSSCDSSISGYKFEDVNENGSFDCDESGVEDWMIDLYQAVTCDDLDMVWADEVISYVNGTQKDGDEIDETRTHPERALGPAVDEDDDNYVSLGYNGSGYIILGFTDNIIINDAGDDIEVIETTYGSQTCATYPEKIDVYVSQYNTDDWDYLDRGCLDSSYDLSDGTNNYEWVQYVKIVDASNDSSFSGDSDGFDVNGVKALHSLCWEHAETTLTGNMGYYEFDGLCDGIYKIVEETKPDWINITPKELILIINGASEMIDFGNKNMNEDPNQAPVADAGGPYYSNINDVVYLDGSDSYDTDGSIVSYEWDLDNDGFYDDATGEIINHMWSSTGMYPISLRVTDDDSATDIDTTMIEIVEEEIKIIKTVKEDCCGEYGKNISVNYSDFVMYKLDVYMNRSSNVLSLHVRDNLPQIDGLVYNESCMHILDDEDNYLPASMYNHTITNNYLYWNFTYFPAQTHYRIIYRADTVACGSYENMVNLSVHVRPCCPSWLYDNDTATVNVICPSGLWVEKLVSLDGNTWHTDSVDAMVGDLVWFKIKVDNLAFSTPVYAVNITDTLPDHVIFDSFVSTDNASEITMGSDWWQIFYQYILDEKIIIFKGKVIDVGYDCNLAVVSSCQENTVSDTACVNVSDGMHVKKQVSIDNSTWMENVSAVAGEQVFWNISVSFASEDQNLSLVEIVFKDVLPDGVEYVGGSSLLYKDNELILTQDPDEDDHQLTWNLTFVEDAWLRNGSVLSLLFATDVTGEVNGTLVNWAEVTALQCNNTTSFDEDSAIVYVNASTNHPPQLTDPVPENNAENVSTDATLRITVSDPDDDSLTIVFYDASDDSIIDTISNVDPTDTVTTTWNNLAYDTAYIWYVTVSDDNITETSPDYQFTTEQEPDNRAPNMPDTESPTNYANGVSLSPTLSVHVSDPDGDSLTVKFYDADTDLLIGTDTCSSDCTASVTWYGLMYGTTYHWYVTVNDTQLEVESTHWRFNTRIPDVQLEIDITGGVGVNAEIMNLGNDDAEDVSWSVHVQNKGLFSRINKSDSGVVDLIEGGGDLIAKKLSLFGVGQIRITVTADCDVIDEPVVETRDALLLGFMVFIQ